VSPGWLTIDGLILSQAGECTDQAIPTPFETALPAPILAAIGELFLVCGSVEDTFRFNVVPELCDEQQYNQIARLPFSHLASAFEERFATRAVDRRLFATLVASIRERMRIRNIIAHGTLRYSARHQKIEVTPARLAPVQGGSGEIALSLKEIRDHARTLFATCREATGLVAAWCR
jgi:hypothetical protein